MSTCISCKSKDSNDRCPNRVILGLQFCGKHVRAPVKRLWHVENDLDRRATSIQKVWRGYNVRYRLSLAGPGVLRRSLCHNDEDVVTFESKISQHPFEYFAFEEDGKVWWFDILSILGCLNSSLLPTNPYTRQPLSTDIRIRLRANYKYRIHNRLPLCHQPMAKRNMEELMELQWMKVCQVMHENGFEDVHPNHFMSLDNNQLLILLNYLERDVASLAMDHPLTSKRYRWAAAIKRECLNFEQIAHGKYRVPSLLNSLFNSMNDPYPFCFILMSALYRV